MSDVKRYRLDITQDEASVAPRAVECERGGWVRASDYDALQSKHDAAVELLRKMPPVTANCQPVETKPGVTTWMDTNGPLRISVAEFLAAHPPTSPKE